MLVRFVEIFNQKRKVKETYILNRERMKVDWIPRFNYDFVISDTKLILWNHQEYLNYY